MLLIHTGSHVLNSSFCYIPDVTSWREGGGRALAPTLAGEAVAEGGAGGAMVMEGAAGAPPIPQQNASSHGPPRTSPTGNPVLPLAQPPIGQQFQAYRGIMPPFVRFVTFSFWHICRECLKLQCIHSLAVLSGCFSLDVSSIPALPTPLWSTGSVQVPIPKWGP